jgi:hypothetical protein
MLLIAVALAGRVNSGPDHGKSDTTDGKAGTHEIAAQSRSNIVVKFLNDPLESPQASLQDAIRSAVGKPAEIILRDEKAIELNLTKPLEVSGGAVVIRAAEGTTPKITVLLTGASSFLRVNSSGALRLSGLTIDFEYHGDRGKMLPSLIETAGELGLDRCAFSTGGPERDLAVAIAEGSRTTITGCVFMGFNNPLRLRSFPGFDTRVRQCLFVRSKPGDQEAGWPLRLTLGQSPSPNPRRVAIDHCTVVGAGLLELEGFTAEQPIRVNVHDSVVKARSLLMWSGASEFPKGLSWKGSANRYSISGASWVVRGPSGFDAVEHGPVNLETWSSATTAEPGSIEDPIQFPAESSAGALLEAGAWNSFQLEESESSSVGIDPAYVGPGAKPLKD